MSFILADHQHRQQQEFAALQLIYPDSKIVLEGEGWAKLVVRVYVTERCRSYGFNPGTVSPSAAYQPLR